MLCFCIFPLSVGRNYSRVFLAVKKRIKRLLKALLVVFFGVGILYVVVFRTSFFLTDIRPEAMKADYVLENNGVHLLKDAQVAHGLDAWRLRDSVRYQVRHRFNGSRVSFFDFSNK